MIERSITYNSLFFVLCEFSFCLYSTDLDQVAPALNEQALLVGVGGAATKVKMLLSLASRQSCSRLLSLEHCY